MAGSGDRLLYPVRCHAKQCLTEHILICHHPTGWLLVWLLVLQLPPPILYFQKAAKAVAGDGAQRYCRFESIHHFLLMDSAFCCVDEFVSQTNANATITSSSSSSLLPLITTTTTTAASVTPVSQPCFHFITFPILGYIGGIPDIHYRLTVYALVGCWLCLFVF